MSAPLLTGTTVAIAGGDLAQQERLSDMLVSRFGFTSFDIFSRVREMLVGLDPIVTESHTVREMVSRFGWPQAMLQRVGGAELQRLVNAAYCATNASLSSDSLWLELLSADMEALRELRGNIPIVITGVNTSEHLGWCEAANIPVWQIGHIGYDKGVLLDTSVDIERLTLRVERELAMINTDKETP